MADSKSRHLQIIAQCPETGELVPTHAWMTPRQLRRFDRQLVFFCPACRRPHLLGGPDLRAAATPCEAVETVAAPRALGRRGARRAGAKMGGEHASASRRFRFSSRLADAFARG